VNLSEYIKGGDKVRYNDCEWKECSKENYDYKNRINYMYIVDEATNEVTYYERMYKIITFYDDYRLNKGKESGK